MKQRSLVSVRAAIVISLTVALTLGTPVIWRSLRAMRSAASLVDQIRGG